MSTDLMIPNDDLDLTHLSATIAAELAAGLTTKDDVMVKYSLTDVQWEKLRNNKVFRSMLKDALIQFTGDMNAGRRIILKSEILLEDALPVLHQMIHNAEGSSQSKIDSIKQLTVLAQKTGGPKEGAAAGGGFSVNIHIRTGEAEQVVIEQPVAEAA
jgi:hypothetical protein